MSKWLGLMLGLLVSVTACAHKTGGPRLPVVICPGFGIGDILAQPIKGRSPADLKAMLDRPWYDAIDVSQDGGGYKPLQAVNSCVDYFIARKKGWIPLKDFEMAVYQARGIACQAVRDVLKARPAVKSFLEDFKLDKKAPEILPKQLALVISATESKRILADSSIRYWSQVDPIQKVEPHGDYQTTYQSFTASMQNLNFVAAGDFNGDGIKDLLLSSSDAVIGGDYRAERMWLLTKLKADGDIKIIKEYQAL